MKHEHLKEVGALTLIQPWAHLILHHGKNVENRYRNSHFRGTVAIHASSKNSKEWFEDCPVRVDRDSVPYGAIIGFAQFVDVITEDQVTRQTAKWFGGGTFGYILEDVMVLKCPVPAKGARGVWRLSGRTLAKCLEQLTASELKRLRPFERMKS